MGLHVWIKNLISDLFRTEVLEQMVKTCECKLSSGLVRKIQHIMTE